MLGRLVLHAILFAIMAVLLLSIIHHLARVIL